MHRITTTLLPVLGLSGLFLAACSGNITPESRMTNPVVVTVDYESPDGAPDSNTIQHRASDATLFPDAGIHMALDASPPELPDSGYTADAAVPEPVDPKRAKFFGMFFPGAGVDCEDFEARVTAPIDRLTVVQDYQNAADLAAGPLSTIVAAHNRGNTVHLNLMPMQAATNATLETRMHSFGALLATELRRVAKTIPGIIITIGPEMNGNWTPEYGCDASGSNGRAREFVAMHNVIVDILRSELAKQDVPRARLRIAWGPNYEPSTGPCALNLYWPGWGHVDFVGYSHYSLDTYQSGPTIVSTASKILAATGLDPNSPLAAGKAMILQTGMHFGTPNYNRGTWFNQIVAATRIDPRLAGMIIFHDYLNDLKLRWIDPQFVPLEGFNELRTEIAQGTAFTQQINWLFERPQIQAVFPMSGNLIMKGENFGAVRATVQVRVDYFDTSHQRRSFSGTAAVKREEMDALYIPLAALIDFDPNASYWAGIGEMNALPNVQSTFVLSPNLVVKGVGFGAANAIVPLIVEYQNSSGVAQVYSGSASVRKEGAEDVLYLSLASLPGLAANRSLWAMVGW